MHNDRMDLFWREHNTNVMIHFKDEFKKLENLGTLDTYDNTSTCAMHCAYAPVIDKRIDEFGEHFNNHMLPASGHKIPLSLCLASSLKNQVINSNMNPETMCDLSQCQNILPMTARRPMDRHTQNFGGGV